MIGSHIERAGQGGHPDKRLEGEEGGGQDVSFLNTYRVWILFIVSYATERFYAGVQFNPTQNFVLCMYVVGELFERYLNSRQEGSQETIAVFLAGGGEDLD